MAQKTKEELITASNNTYTTNGQGAITASSVRSFNGDLFDSVPTIGTWVDLDYTIRSGTGNIFRLKAMDLGPFFAISVNLSISQDTNNLILDVTNFDFGSAGGSINESGVCFFYSGEIVSVSASYSTIMFRRPLPGSGASLSGKFLIMKNI